MLVHGGAPDREASAPLSPLQMDPKSFGTILASGTQGLANLTEIVRTDAELDWPDIVPFVRDMSSSYNGQVVGMPTEANMNLLYYRRDLFKQHNLTVPATWDDLLAIVRQWNATDPATRNGTDMGICLDWRTGEA